jgi:uncharacterized protein
MCWKLARDIIDGKNTLAHYLDRGIDINYDEGLYLELATRYNHKVIVKYLVKKGINVEARDCYSIHVAIGNGHTWISKFLIEHMLDKRKPLNAELLVRASEYNRLNLLKILIKHVIKPELCLDDCLTKAVVNGNITIVKYLLKKFPYITYDTIMTKIHLAAIYGHLRIVKYFIILSSGIKNLNLLVYKALTTACSHDKLNIVFYMMNNYPGCFSKEDLNNAYLIACESKSSSSLLKELERTKKINCYGKALEIVTQKKYSNLSKYLVKKCTEHQINEAFIKCKSWWFINLFLQNGANVHYAEEKALKNAILDSNTHLINYLIGKGANIHINNEEPLILALSSEVHNKSIIELLIRKGSDIELAAAIIMSQDQPNMYAISNLSLYYEEESFYGEIKKTVADVECGICLTNFKKTDIVFICKVCRQCVHNGCKKNWKGKCIYCRN